MDCLNIPDFSRTEKKLITNIIEEKFKRSAAMWSNAFDISQKVLNVLDRVSGSVEETQIDQVILNSLKKEIDTFKSNLFVLPKYSDFWWEKKIYRWLQMFGAINNKHKMWYTSKDRVELEKILKDIVLKNEEILGDEELFEQYITKLLPKK